MQIRTAAPPDAPELARVHVQAWRETYRELMPEAALNALSVDERSRTWQQTLNDPAEAHETRVHLAEIAGAIVGFGACGAQRTERLAAGGFDGEISALYVLNAFQRRGIGGKLMRAMASDLSARGYRAIALWVASGNMQARRFYEWCGGEVVAYGEEPRVGVVLAHAAYAWTNLDSLSRKLERSPE